MVLQADQPISLQYSYKIKLLVHVLLNVIGGEKPQWDVNKDNK
jgi:hypothetical protein